MSTAHWNESEHSDEDVNQDSLSNRKRSSRACDQCRKTKSKCEPSNTPGSCKSCALAGNACTFLGPSYKRGPPKGYIQAIEQRWHQVESLVGALLACPDRRVQDLLGDIRQDELAREVLNRVDTGPFGPSGRLSQPAGATKEDFFACIFRSNETSSRDAARSRRQSRISREIVSSSRDNALSTVPTAEWQDRLSARLARSALGGSSATASQSPVRAFGGAPLPQRRRLEESSSGSVGPSQPNWNHMYTMEASSDSEDTDESHGATALGQLSLDENQEVRYHGKASGLHLLIHNDRVDSRVDGGVWRLPMARFWPSAKADVSVMPPEVDIPVTFPPVEIQDRLIDLYFSYAHPIFPVIHKGRFLREYTEWKRSNPNSPSSNADSPSSAPEPSQTVSKLLLLSIFSVADRYLDERASEPVDMIWDDRCDYLTQARNVLAQVSHSCRASTCQALLLLGQREFGIGSMEQGWLYIGMAIRMAQDLGLNRAADNWQFNGRRMFSAEENQVRKQIWWACCIADKYSSTYMGRPICIDESDFDTLLPDAEEYEDDSHLSRQSDVVSNKPSSTVLIMKCFRAASSLSVIIGSIVSSVYPVKSSRGSSRRAVLSNLEARLDRWYLELPDDLRYDPASKRNTPSPPVLYIHIKYWCAVLLLHRAFIPNWKGSEAILQNPPGSNTASLKAFDLCQSAATYISTIATTYHETFNIKRASPFLSSYILSAGIMHIVTLTLRPSNVQAYIGLQQSLASLREMQTTWPSAARAWDLLHGVKVQVDSNLPPLLNGPDRQKRGADDAFGGEKSSDVLQREAFGDPSARERITSPSGIQDISTRMMAHMLGLDIPGIEPSTSYYPGYEWWPRTTNVAQQPPPYPQQSSITSASSSESVMSMSYPVSRGDTDWRISSANYPYDYHGSSNNHYRI